MKVTVEKTPDGVQVTLTYATDKRPIKFIVPRGQATLLADMVRTAEAAILFRFELHLDN